MGRLPIIRWFLIAVGVCALVLGGIGVVVPLLPTTPFLLLAAACFIRSSDRLYSWLIHQRWVGGYIRNYRDHRAMTLRAKVIVLTLLWGVIGCSALTATDSWWMRLLLATVAAGVTLHLVYLKTAQPAGSSGALPLAPRAPTKPQLLQTTGPKNSATPRLTRPAKEHIGL